MYSSFNQKTELLFHSKMNPKYINGYVLIFFSAMGPELEPSHFLTAAESLCNTTARKDWTRTLTSMMFMQDK